VKAVCSSVSRPVNVLAVAGFSVDALREAGAKRISVGSKLSTVAFGAVRRAALEMLEQGTFEYARNAMPFGDLQSFFAKRGNQEYTCFASPC